QVRRDIIVVNLLLLHVGHGQHNNIGPFRGISGIVDLEAELLSNGARFTFWIQADNDVTAAFLKVQGVRMALRTEADDREGLSVELRQVGVFVCVYFRWHNKMSCYLD